jgi:hypothetical protein
MATSFFNPNWREINKAINAGSLKELRAAQKDMEKKIQKKVNDYFSAKRRKEIEDHKAELKALAPETPIYFIGYSDKIPFGQKCTKLFDGRTRIHFDCAGIAFNCPYNLLRLSAPTTDELRSHRVAIHITKVANEIFNRDNRSIS